MTNSSQDNNNLKSLAVVHPGEKCNVYQASSYLINHNIFDTNLDIMDKVPSYLYLILHERRSTHQTTSLSFTTKLTEQDILILVVTIQPGPSILSFISGYCIWGHRLKVLVSFYNDFRPGERHQIHFFFIFIIR